MQYRPITAVWAHYRHRRRWDGKGGKREGGERGGRKERREI